MVFAPPIRVPGERLDDRNVDWNDTLGFSEYIFEPFLSILNITLEEAEFALRVNRGI